MNHYKCNKRGYKLVQANLLEKLIYWSSEFILRRLKFSVYPTPSLEVLIGVANAYGQPLLSQQNAGLKNSYSLFP